MQLPKTVQKHTSKIMWWDDERRLGNSIIVTLAYGWCFEDKGSHCFGVSTVAETQRDLSRVMPCDCARCLSKQGG